MRQLDTDVEATADRLGMQDTLDDEETPDDGRADSLYEAFMDPPPNPALFGIFFTIFI